MSQNGCSHKKKKKKYDKATQVGFICHPTLTESGTLKRKRNSCVLLLQFSTSMEKQLCDVYYIKYQIYYTNRIPCQTLAVDNLK